MMLALPLAWSHFSNPWIPFQYNLLDGDLCKKLFYSNCLFFLTFKHDFFQMRWFHPYRSFKTASDDVTNSVKHRTFNTHLLNSCTHILSEIYEKSSHNGGFEYDFMMIIDSGHTTVSRKRGTYVRNNELTKDMWTSLLQRWFILHIH